jgi:IS5 family transposase
MQRFFEVAKERMKGEPIMQLVGLIDWPAIDARLDAESWRDAFRNGGRLPYDRRSMVRALLLARWCGLSYPKLERALRVRLDFLLFCGFEGAARLPDACTLNRFKARLPAGLFEVIASEAENQLAARGVSMRPAPSRSADLKLGRVKWAA